MSLGLIGKKCGMTHIFAADGSSIPITVVHITPNKITQIKTIANDGYNAIQVTTGFKKRSNVNKPISGHYAKACIEPGRGLWEFPINKSDQYKVGLFFDVSIFRVGQKVDVKGISKGKGFQGCIKRHNFSSQDSSHGNSLAHRVHGSTGQNQTPGRVFKNKKMAGHLGNKNITIQSLEILKIDSKNNLLLLKGSIPGAINGNIIITPAVKS